MSKYHIDQAGNPRLCKASVKPCPLGGEHYESSEAARAAYEESMGTTGSSTFVPTVPAPLVPPTSWQRILSKPNEYPTYLADAFKRTEQSDSGHFVEYDEYQEADWAGESTYNLSDKVNLYSGHWIEAKVGVLDGEVKGWFMHGHCAALALELAPMKTGRVVAFEVETPQLTGERWVHAAALNEDGTCLDVEGVKDVNSTAAKYGAKPVQYDLNNPAERQAFMDLTSSGKDKEQAFNDYYSPLEQAMIRHYAELVFHTN